MRFLRDRRRRATALARFALLGLALAAPLGCAAQRVTMYSGPVAPHETATVTGQFDRNDLQVSIESVDGIPVPGYGPIRGGIYGRETTVVVEPGSHRLGITFASQYVSLYEPMPVMFTAAAGGDYEIRVARDPKDADTFWSALQKFTIGGREQWIAWVIDRRTNAVVQPTYLEATRSIGVPPVR